MGIWLLGGESQSDADRPYAPTAHRLEWLRRHGAGPHSPALRATAAITVGAGAGAAVAAAAPRVFAAVLARCCDAAADARLSAAWLSWPVLGAVALVAAMAFAAWLADGLVAGFGTRRLGRAAVDRDARLWSALRTAAIGAAAAIAVAAAWWLVVAAACGGFEQWSRLLAASLAAAAAGIGVVAAADVALAYGQFVALARMSRADVIEELRETRGPLIWRTVREQRMRRHTRR